MAPNTSTSTQPPRRNSGATCLSNNDVLRLAELDLNETPKRRSHCLRELRHWLNGQQHLINVRQDNCFLLRFLRFKKFDLPETQTTLDKYVQMRATHPEWFRNLDIRDPKLRELMSSGYLIVLPDRDDNGRRVVFSRAAALDVSRFTATDIMRAHILTYETLLTEEENQVRTV